MKKNWLEKIGRGIGVASALLIACIIFGAVFILGAKLLSWLWLL